MAKKKAKKKVAKKKAAKPKVKVEKMTPRRELFCRDIAASPKPVIKDIYRNIYGSSDKCSEVGSSKLMALSIIKKRIAELQKPALKKAKVSVARVMTELTRGGLYDPALIFDENNCILPVPEMPIEIRAAIASIEVTEEYKDGEDGRKFVGYTKKIKFHNKPKLLELLGKTNVLNMFTEHIKIDEMPADKKAIEKASKDIAKHIAIEVAKINK